MLISGQPEAAAGLAVTKYGAAGIVSWAQNQKQAWWGDDESLIRWGHSTQEGTAFAFWWHRPAAGRQERWRRARWSGSAAVAAGRMRSIRIRPRPRGGRDKTKEIRLLYLILRRARTTMRGCSGVLGLHEAQPAEAEGRLPQPNLLPSWPARSNAPSRVRASEFARRTLGRFTST